MKTKKIALAFNPVTKSPQLTIELIGLSMERAEELVKSDFLNVDIAKWSESKTLSQNGYAWALLTEIAKETKLNRMEVYKKLLRDNKNFDDVLVPCDKEVVKLKMQLDQFEYALSLQTGKDKKKVEKEIDKIKKGLQINVKNDERLKRLNQMYRIVDNFGITNFTTQSGNEVKGYMLRLYRGMSDYTKDELKEFLELIAMEAEQLGINTNPELYKGVCKV